VSVCRQRVARFASHRVGGFCRRVHRRGEQPGRERPHLWTPDPDPRVGSGVAHVPAACLKSRDGLRTPMSRTIDSGSDTKCTRQSGARFVTIRGRSSAANDAVISWSIWRHISPPGCRQITRPSRVDFHAVLGGVNALRCASTVRSARPAGVDPACAPLDLAFARWSRFDRR
jgi:hypothetical protein